MRPRVWFVTGTDTGVGKTLVTRLLIDALRLEGTHVRALKPVESGCHWDRGVLVGDDGRQLSNAQTCSELETTFSRFEAPLAPSVAARLSGTSLSFSELQRWTENEIARDGQEVVLVEGVGGLMVPLTAQETVLDLIHSLKPVEVILVARNRLGVLSQVLCAARLLEQTGLRLNTVVLSARGPSTDLSVRDNAVELRRWGLNVFELPRVRKGRQSQHAKALLLAIRSVHRLEP